MDLQPTRDLPATAAGGASLARTLRPLAVLTVVASLGIVPVPSRALAHGSADSPKAKAPDTLKPDTGSLLVEYYKNVLRTRDLDAFTQQVPARFTREGLARLAESNGGETRRAAIFALGLFGSIEDNALLARALRDVDPIVRSHAEGALWAVWFRADTPENNRMLEQVRDLIGERRPEEAIRLADRLIDRSPKFAEAYNQRAIAEFTLGRFDASAADCRRVLELNPYHIGALGGLAQCEIRLDRRGDAIKTLRRSLKLQPHSKGIRETISLLESAFD
jgi:tetratricopeptide (TPR) repeat protein